MARFTRILICLLAAIVITDYASHHYQFHSGSVAWHVLYGDSISVAGYRIPVPSQWSAEQLASDDARLLNTRTGEAIWLQSLPKPSMFSLTAWSDFVQNQMNDARNPIVGRTELTIAGEPLVCLERDFAVNLRTGASANPSPQTSHLPSIECNSAGLLGVMFFAGTHTQHDYSEFYSLMASIEKNSQ
ncbi:MAG TPA: hypothetical protein VFO39_13030 [Candidatus Sulfotelmatobacter sp.]|nr:hypothetical protein [Candidatus Sulfotelmatobacter sp.]